MIIISNNANKKIYDFAEKYLNRIRPETVSEEEFKAYYIADNPAKNLKEITKGLIHSLQNSQMMPKVIGFDNDNNKSKFDRILFNYDHKKILKEYKTGDILFDKFNEIFIIRNAESKNNLWKRFSYGIISGCEFLSTFDNIEDFYDFINMFEKNIHTQMALPLILEKEIYGLGFALACDFLKELGCVCYPKPDVHLMDIFYQLGLSKRDEISVYKAIIYMANDIQKTPYEVDKTFWLICSGNWYRHEEIAGEELKIDGKKKEFIEEAKKMLSIG